MTEVQRIAVQLGNAYAGTAWHGPSLTEALTGVSAADAAAHPVRKAHSIWEIVHHLHAGYGVVSARLRGERADISDAEDWPPVPEPSEAAWKRDRADLDRRHQELVAQITHLQDAGLDAPIVANYSSVYRTLHGHIQHVAYHAGQMVLLRKSLAS
jgi:uncharacterized damage-inducible protein DinB